MTVADGFRFGLGFFLSGIIALLVGGAIHASLMALDNWWFCYRKRDGSK